MAITHCYIDMTYIPGLSMWEHCSDSVTPNPILTQNQHLVSDNHLLFEANIMISNWSDKYIASDKQAEHLNAHVWLTDWSSRL